MEEEDGTRSYWKKEKKEVQASKTKENKKKTKSPHRKAVVAEVARDGGD